MRLAVLPSFRFQVLGTPKTQGSMTVYNGRVTHANRPALIEWRTSVAYAAKAACPNEWDIAAPVSVRAVFLLKRPQRHYRGKDNLLREDAPRFHAIRPDLDKLARAVMDALTESGVILDDSQVIKLRASKGYAFDPTSAGVLCEIQEAGY